MKKKRADGFYWVRKSKWSGWEPAQYRDGVWNVLDDFAELTITCISNDGYFYMIGPRFRKRSW